MASITPVTDINQIMTTLSEWGTSCYKESNSERSYVRNLGDMRS